MAFDPLNFTSNAGKTIGSLATQSASAVTSTLSGNFINGLSKTGLSLDSLKSVSAEKMDSLNSSLSGVAGYRITQQDLFKSRSADSSSEPIATVTQSRESQQTKQERFPLNLSDAEYMQIEFSKYDRPSPLMPAKFNTEYSVALPLPRDLSEQHSVRINPQDTGLLGMFTDQIKSIVDTAQGKGSNNDVQDSVGLMYAGISTAVQQSGIGIPGLSGEQVAQTAGQFLKAVPNPHISVFFNGVDMRPPMEFSWLFTARNPTESSKIKNIIKQFKQRTLPAVSKGAQNLMAYPQMVRLTLFPWGEKFNQNGNWTGTMPMYKLGLISAIHINYSPNGLSFFNDPQSSPTFVVFSFTFQEIEVITGQDYGNNDHPEVTKKDIDKLVKGGIAILSNVEKNFSGGN
jgi:hypothetical protein